MKKNRANKKEKTYTESQVAVLLEEIRSQQKAIFEGQEFIKSNIEALETSQAKIWEKLTQIDLRLIKVEKDVEGLKKMIAKNTEDVTAINARLDHIEQDIHLIKEDFGKRVTIIEAKVASLNR